jgi:hypothetical protein
MKVKVSNQELDVTSPTPEPIIVVTANEVNDRGLLGVVRIDVENDEGVVSRFWVDVKVKKGRPQVFVRTKVGRDKQIQRQSKVQGTFNCI